MKLIFYQLFILFILINTIQCQSCPNLNVIYQNLYDATVRLIESLKAPLCTQLLLNLNNTQSQYISPNGLTGRVLPPGTFPTTVLALEYLYGILCPIPNLPTPAHVVQTYKLVRISYDKELYITQNEFILNLTNNKQLTFIAAVAFDRNLKVCGYDGQIRNFGLTIDSYANEDRAGKINAICNTTQRFCNGTLKQYDSVSQCVQYLTNNVTYGTYDRADQGNVVCRLIHIKFVPLVPEIHCEHVGPSGGAACSDKTPDFYYNQPNFLSCAYNYSQALGLGGD